MVHSIITDLIDNTETSLAASPARLLEFALANFHRAGDNHPALMESCSALAQARNEQELRCVIAGLQADLEPWRAKTAAELTRNDLNQLRTKITDRLTEIDRNGSLMPEPCLEFFIEQGYLETAEEFLLQARMQDGSLTMEEVFQALRNVWIMNSLQLLWGIPLSVTPSVYAYSMLYPYTDNFLDDPQVDPLEKEQFNPKLSLALGGEFPAPAGAHQRRVFELVDQIRTQYDPVRYPQVFEGIRLIQQGQILSLMQDRGKTMSPEELLTLSFFKGGASVLADALLVRPDLTESELTYAFEYGASLQLLDDMQDQQNDRRDRHQTLFSQVIPPAACDELIQQLLSYLQLIHRPTATDSVQAARLKRIIATWTGLMVFDAVGRNPSLTSTALYRALEAASKVRLNFYQEIEASLSPYLDQMDSIQTLADSPANLP